MEEEPDDGGEYPWCQNHESAGGVVAGGGGLSPDHHRPGGGFRNPWGGGRGERRTGGFFRWQLERALKSLPPNPHPEELPLADPDVRTPRGVQGELRATWVGHATLLLQMGRVNVLTDPIWSRRCSPVQWSGPARLAPPGLSFGSLPAVDVVLLTHDHYDHLDVGTVRRLHGARGAELTWVTPLGYREWFARLGVWNVVELDWDQTAVIEADGAPVSVTAVPSRHWTRRRYRAHTRLWCSFVVSAPGGGTTLFVGDSGYFAEFATVGPAFGPFDLIGMPIGAYDPRWFMAEAHMNPEEAVRTYLDLGGRGVMAGLHWGTFRLTDEDMLEPPVRAKAAWRKAGLPKTDLWIPQHGETHVLRVDGP